jgi:hypothetical protein
MFKIIYVILLLFALSLFAQPTMNQGNMPQIGTKAEFIFYESENVEPGPAGANQTWDFSNIVKSADQSGATSPEFVAVSEAFQKDDFPDATLAEKSDTAYTFYKIENNQLIRLGTGYDVGAEILTDAQLQYQIPFSYGDSYTDDFAGTNFIAEFESDRSGTITTEADAYGTIKVGEKTYDNALRLKTYIEITDIVEMEFQGFPVTATITTELTSYSWVLEGQYYPVFSMTDGVAITEAGGMEFEQEIKNAYGIAPGNISQLSSPIQIAPEDGATDLEIPVKLEWVKSQFTSFPQLSQSIEYTLQVSLDNAFADETKEYITFETSYIVTELMPATGYYWRVKASINDTESEWSEIRTFITAESSQELTAPELISPDNLAYDVSLTPVFEWNNDGNADSWVISLDNNPQFSMPILENTVNVNQYTSEMELDYDTQYFWRVKSVSGENESDWSEVWSFKTESNLPEKPLPSKPENMASEVSIMPVLEWSENEKATSYNLIISDNSDLMTIIADVDISETSYSPETELEYETTYYWAVRGGNETGWGEFSEIWSFTTETASSVVFDNESDIVKIIPNPASETILIEFKESITEVLSAEIINSNGIPVMQLSDKDIISGTLDISDLSAGKYFIRITSRKNYIIPFIKE